MKVSANGEVVYNPSETKFWEEMNKYYLHMKHPEGIIRDFLKFQNEKSLMNNYSDFKILQMQFK